MRSSSLEKHNDACSQHTRRATNSGRSSLLTFRRAYRTAARQHKLPCCVESRQSELPTALMKEDRGYEHGECECHGACPEES